MTPETMTPEAGRNAVVAPAGRLDAVSAQGLELQLAEALTRGAATLIIDLSQLTFISSAGLRVILLAERRAKAVGCRIRVCAASPLVREVFEVSGLTAVIRLYPGREEAAAAGCDASRLD